MTYIRAETYGKERDRPKLLAGYLQNVTSYLIMNNPTASLEEIDSFVKKTINERFKSPTVEAVHHKTEGNSEIVKLPLHKYIETIIADNNLSPSGTSYLLVSRRESFLRVSLEEKIAVRNKFKKMYLDFEARGMKRESQYYYVSQANAKIFNNAIAGGMNITQFILGCKAGFNAITSVGRLSVKQGYSIVERAVNGNLYLPTTQSAITYILNHVQTMPEEFEKISIEYNLYTPTVFEVREYFVDSLLNYVSDPSEKILMTVISNLTDTERSYVFYAGCFKNLCHYNDKIIRAWIDSCFITGPIDPSLYKDIDLKEIKSFDDDLIVCVLGTNYRRLGEFPDKPGKWNSIKDAMTNNPEGLKEFIYCCKHFDKNFKTLLPLLKSIMQVHTTFSKMVFQQRMARQTVPLSDTDSNIFSTQELIRWKRGKLDFSQEAYEMNALTVFILSQTLEHIFARLSCGFGMEGKDIFKISMKNEFLFPVLISTSLAKHYIAIATMQEGALLTVPRKEIKGVGLRSSAYPKIIRDEFENYVTDLIKIIEKAEPLKAASVLKVVADLERCIYNSIRERESIYLQTVSIKQEQDYADAMASAYFYYKLWTDVFAADYGEMAIPNKCYKIPLIGGKKLFKDKVFLEQMSINYPGIYSRLIPFLEGHPGRDITAILIPPVKGKIPQFFLEIMDIRSHISQSMAGFYHLLSALGIGTVDNRSDMLVSDFYDPSIPIIQ